MFNYNLLLSVIYVSMIITIVNFFTWNTNFMTSLIILEILMLYVLLSMFILFLMLGQTLWLFLLVLSLAACEAAMGLSILLSYIKLLGNDQLKSSSCNSWFA